MADVFISYSRRDKVFMRRLFEALEGTGRDAWVDWEGIPYSAEWWKEIQTGIDQADTFLFLVTPDSLASKICNEELAYAYKRNKRIVPVIRREINEKEMAGFWYNRDWEFQARENWEMLKRINWLYFRRKEGYECQYDEQQEVLNPECDGPDSDYDNFDRAFHALLRTVDTDIEHVRMHTRLLVRAREWENGGRNRSFLLRGDDLIKAEVWLAAAGGKEQKPDELHTEYILASRATERRQQRTLLAGVSTGLLVATVLSILSFLLFRQSEDRLTLAEQRGTGEANQGFTAIAAQFEAENQATLAFNAAQTSDANAVTATIAVATAVEAQQESEQQATIAWQNAATSNANALLAQNNAVTATIAQGEAELQATLAWQNAGTAISAQSTSDASAILADRNAATSNANARLAQENAATATTAQGEAELQATLAWQNAGTAVAAQSTSDANAILAQNNAATSEANLRAAWNSQALFLADQSRQQLLAGAPQEALLLALESLAHYEDGIFNPAGQNALLNAVTYPVREVAYMPHDGNISWALWNSDGTRVISYSVDGTARVWDAQTGEPLLILLHQDQVRSAYWTDNESKIVTASMDGTARLWDATTGELLFMIRHAEAVNSVTLNTDRTLLLTSSNDNTARLWDVQTGEQIFRFDHAGDVLSAIWDTTRQRILTWGRDGKIKIWNASTGELLFTLEHADEEGYFYASLNREQNRLVSWGDDGTVKIWAIESGELLSTLPHGGWISGVRWSQDETHLLSHGNDIFSTCSPCIYAAYIWDTNTGQKLVTMSHDEMINGEEFNADESRVLTWSQDSTARIWDARTGEELLRLQHEDIVWSARWSKDGSRILTVAGDGGVRIWDSITGSLIVQMSHAARVNAAAWSPDESRILSWSADRSLRIWEISGGEILPTVYHPDEVRVAAWNTDETMVISRSRDAVLLWEAATGEIIRSFDGYTSARWSSNGKTILLLDNTPLACNRNCLIQLQIYDPATDTILRTFHQENEIFIMEWEGNELITYSLDGAVHIFNTDTGDETFSGTFPHTNASNVIYFGDWNTDKSRILTFSSSTAIMWDVSAQIPLFTIQHDDEVFAAELNSENTRVLTYSRDGTVRSWDASTGEEIARLPLGESVHGFEIDQDERRILAWSANAIVHVWDPVTGEELLTLVDAGQNGAMWNSDKTRIVTASTTGLITVWDGNTGEKLLMLHPGETDTLIGSVWEMTWNEDETKLLVVYADNDLSDNLGGAVRVWDITTGQMLVEFFHPADVTSAVWSEDEQRILAWSRDGMVRIWPLELEGLIEIAQAEVTRPLSNEERESFFVATLIPTATPQATPTPTLTPLPTLTPEPVLPTATAPTEDIGFSLIIPGDIAGFTLTSERLVEDSVLEYEDSAPILAPSSPAYQYYYTGTDDMAIFIIESQSPYATLQTWRDATGITAGEVVTVGGVEIFTFAGDGFELRAFIIDGVFISIFGDGLDENTMQGVVEAVIPE